MLYLPGWVDQGAFYTLPVPGGGGVGWGEGVIVLLSLYYLLLNIAYGIVKLCQYHLNDIQIFNKTVMYMCISESNPQIVHFLHSLYFQ